MNSIIWWCGLILAGLCTGSLLNVVIYRLPVMMTRRDNRNFNLWLPRSHCPQCNSLIRWFDNLPVISWLRLRGRCRHCRQPVSLRYPLTELATALITLLQGIWFPPGEVLLAALLLSWMLIALAIIDLRHFLLPDALTLPLLWLGLCANLSGALPRLPLDSAVLGAIAGYLSLYLLSQGYWLLRGKAAMGLGDAKLLAALGCWTGWESLPRLLLLASVIGITGSLLAKGLANRPLSAPIPFGPALALSGWLIFMAQNG